MSEEVKDPGERSSTKVRKQRPEIQIYRPPGALRKGDSQTSLRSESDTQKARNGTSSERLNDRRRRSNDTESVSSQRDSGNTTPDALALNEERSWNIRKNNRNENYDDRRTFLSDRRPPRENRDRHKDAPNTSRSSYNSTQSLYDTGRPGGYLNSKPQPKPFERASNNFAARSSIRSENAITKRRSSGGRRRNDSINSTQSEMPSQAKSELNVDTNLETQSQCGASFPQFSGLSYQQLCDSLQSFSSMDWSKTMEEEGFEQSRQEELEEEQRRQDAEKERNNEMAPNENSHRRNGRPRRQRNDSDRSSSFGGSIAEEAGEEYSYEEPRSGERTPTFQRSYGPTFSKESPKSRYGGPKNYYDNEYARTREERDAGWQKSEKKKASQRSRYRGEHDDRDDEIASYSQSSDRRFDSGRLAGRVSFVGASEQRQILRPQRDAKNIPPGSTRDSVPSKESLSSNETKRGLTIDDIAKKEGIQVQKLNDEIASLVTQVSRNRNSEAAKKLIELSGELSRTYMEFLTRDIVFTFSNRVELHIWRQAFHKIIETFRSCANSAKSDAKIFRAYLSRFLLQAIEFYSNVLLPEYERAFEISLSEALIWPNGSPQSLDRLIPTPLPIDAFNSSTQRTALKSLARNLISLGDLYRYQTLNNGSEDYSLPRSFYLQASQLWAASGHCYNQLGVVAFYSERVLDEVFFLVRALAAAHPYEAARERLAFRLAAMRKKVERYEPLISSECGKVEEDVIALTHRPREIWISKTSAKLKNETKEENDEIFSYFRGQQPSKLHRRTVSYIIDTVGMLLLKIGMENFARVSERAFAQLAASLEQRDSPFSSMQLVQISLLFIHVAHVSAIKSLESGSVPQLTPLRAVFSLLSTFLRVLLDEKDEIIGYFSGEGDIQRTVLRVLPALNFLCDWFLSEEFQTTYGNTSSVEALPNKILQTDVWQLLDSVECFEPIAMPSTEIGVDFVFPELLICSSFLHIEAKGSRFRANAEESSSIGFSCRIRLERLLQARSFLLESGVLVKSSEELDVDSKSKKRQSKVQSLDSSEPLTREEILDKERRKTDVVLVVQPENIVPDTNTLIDHLEVFKRILDSKEYHILVPTIVIGELIGLSLGRYLDMKEDVRLNSKAAVTWLREQVQLKNPLMSTITTQGSKMALSMASEETEDGPRKINDDLIIQCCTALVGKTPEAAIGAVSELQNDGDTRRLFRNVVILSEDRGVTIKATAQQIPCRTVPSFIKWARL
ncbi:unnamed protein product [Caenorhabditis auriculariae]|uniref:PIN domain-containing protein n=1 Tax=Caenorhabditis auriculariae TaxID=2777116 RepID=A0A8S1GZQ1_9PELO|nr:unnamed protein product [Caenorhabditis auriculariae]